MGELTDTQQLNDMQTKKKRKDDQTVFLYKSHQHDSACSSVNLFFLTVIIIVILQEFMVYDRTKIFSYGEWNNNVPNITRPSPPTIPVPNYVYIINTIKYIFITFC